MTQLEKTFIITEAQLLVLQNELKFFYETTSTPQVIIEDMIRITILVDRCPAK